MKEGLSLFKGLSANDKDWVTSKLLKEGPSLTRSQWQQLTASIPHGERQPHVFLSHSSKDKQFVRSLARRLHEHNVAVWLDEAELRIGDSLIQRLSSAVHEVDFVLAVISPNSIDSRWVQEELHLAMTRQIEGKQMRVLPLLKGKCEVPEFLRGRLYADFTSPHRRQRNFPHLVQSIQTHFAETAD